MGMALVRWHGYYVAPACVLTRLIDLANQAWAYIYCAFFILIIGTDIQNMTIYAITVIFNCHLSTIYKM